MIRRPPRSTLFPYPPLSRSVNGFAFHDYTSAALLEALERALAVFPDARRWRMLQQAGMREDHSWDRSARERSEEHTSDSSHGYISYAVFCLKKKKKQI